MNISIIITAAIAYIIGAIPTGYLIAQLKGIADIRAHGSGNIGATNVSRVLGMHYFFLIFFLDAGKAFLCIYLAQPYYEFNDLCIFATALLIGNGCSLFLRGSGGKGVATLFGLIAALCPMAAIILLGVWTFFLSITRTVGLASINTVACLPLYAYTTHNNPFFLFSIFAALWIIYSHRTNIQSHWKQCCQKK